MKITIASHEQMFYNLFVATLGDEVKTVVFTSGWRCLCVEDLMHIACPCCKNKRLFDLLPGSTGIVSIKCPICKAVVAISLHDCNAVRKQKTCCTEQIGA